MVKLKIYIFRHGQTTFNRDGRFTGWLDTKLTPLGIKQARTIARKLKNKKFQIAFHTRHIRTKQTLKHVLKYHPECNTILEDDRMIERNYGDLNGTAHTDFIRKEVKKFLGVEEYELIHRGYNVPPPHGESFAMVETRVKSFIKYLISLMKKSKVSVAISASGNSIRLFKKILEKASEKQAVQWVIPYDNYYEYTVNA